MRLKIVALLSLPFLCLPLTLHAQNKCAQIGSGHQMCTNYTTTTALTPFDNLANAKTINTFHLNSQTLSSLAAGTDFVCGLDSANAVHCRYPVGPDTWTTETQLGNPHALAVIAAGQFWGLLPDSTHCNNNGYGVNYFGSAWTYASACLSQIAAAADSTVGGANTVSHTAHFIANGTGSWIQVPGTTWAAYYPMNYQEGFGLKTDGSVWQYYKGTVTQIASSACSALAPDLDGTLYALCGGGAAYKYNGTGWDQLLGGPFTALANGGMFNVWAIGPTQSGSNTYHFPDQGLQASVTITGNTTCNDGNGHQITCPTSTHTPTVSAKFGSRSVSGGQTVTGQPVTPETQVNVKAMDSTYDPFDCLDNGFDSIGCLGYSGQGPAPNAGSVQCSIAGLIFQEDFPPLPIDFTVAEVTHQRLSGPPSGCTPTWDRDSNWCWYPVVASCPNPPPYMFTDAQVRSRQDIADAPPPGGPTEFWLVYNLCLKWENTGWTCLPLNIALPRAVNPNVTCAIPY